MSLNCGDEIRVALNRRSSSQRYFLLIYVFGLVLMTFKRDPRMLHIWIKGWFLIRDSYLIRPSRMLLLLRRVVICY